MIDPNALPVESHLDPHQVAGYIAGTLPIADRRLVEAHLADCEPCTEELAAVAQLARPQASPRRWLPAAAVAAAAVAALVLVAPWRSGTGGPTHPLRGGGTSATIAIVTPADGAAIGADPTLVWRSVPRASTYRWTVTAADGDSLASGYTSDTAVRLPATVLEAPGRTRRWYVDALLSDGSSASTGIHEFRTSQ
jgi:hypothetical protein